MMLSYYDFKEKYFPEERDLNVIYDAYARFFKDNVQIGDGATVCYWSDRHAGTVIRKTARTITIRQDKATLSPNWKPEFIPGGFAAHCVNQNEQEWLYEPDEDGRIYVAYWSEKKVGYYSEGLRVISGRHEFYDYNF